MKKSQIIEMVRQEVQKRMHQLTESVRKRPTSFVDYRYFIAKYLEQVGAPAGLVDEIRDFHLAGGEVVSATYDSWQNIESDLYDSDGEFIWPQDALDYIDDAVSLAISAYADSTEEEFDTAKIATDFHNAIMSDIKAGPSKYVKPFNESASTSNAMRDMMNFVVEILESTGAVSDITRNMAPNSPHARVMYKSNMPTKRFFSLIATEAKRAGLSPALETFNDGSTGWIDETSNLKVYFYDRIAIIMQ